VIKGIDVIIFFGSQTGMAQCLANQLAAAIDWRFSKQPLVAN
jgi:flavodoxin